MLATAMAMAVPGAWAADPPRDLGKPDPWLNLNLHLYGFSYHTDQQGTQQSGLDNQLNPGLGLNFTLHEDERGIGFAEAGMYRDSGSHTATLAGVGYQYKLGKRWRLGGALVGMQSPTYNDGDFFIAPLPILTFDLGPAKLNAVYVPRYGDYNRFAVYGFYFSVPLGG